MFSRDIFTADGILKEIESFTGVNRVELFVLTDTTSYDGWMVREVEKRLNQKKKIRQKQQPEQVLEVMS